MKPRSGAMKEMTMLDPDKVDLRSLCDALEDHSDETIWWLDPRTGQVEPGPNDSLGGEDAEEEDLASRGWVPIEPAASGEGYGDMQDFIARVRDPRARELLERAIAGRGAFRRFKDTLFEFPELREVWFAFHDSRMRRRALEWLKDRGLVDPDAADRELAALDEPQPQELSGPFDPVRIAERVAEDLRGLYGDRLRRVLLFGSWARGDAHPESDIDLLVVLDRVDSPWDELRAMDDIMWRHSIENTTVVSAHAVSEEDFDRPTRPTLIRAKIEGRAVA